MDVAVHSRSFLGSTMDAMHAQHGADCAGPPAQHLISAFEDAVFQCRDHVMTSINGVDYGVVYLTPNHMVDFSRGEAVVSIDASTLVASRRDWWDIWITPYDENLALPSIEEIPDLQGPPRRAVQVEMRTFNGNQTGFVASVFNGFQRQTLPSKDERSYERVLTPDAARRDKFELRISQNRIRFGMPAYNLWWVDTPIANLGWNQGVVQIGHHSYNPAKDDIVPGAHAGTWHWDNLYIKPARPFTIIRAQQRSAYPVATFPQAAPANARLRFAGYGTGMQVSFDSGRTWSNATRQAQPGTFTDHFSSYWTPIPAGTTRVHFRGQPGCCPAGPAVRDVSIWAL
jgi:hypothetical protein